MQTSTDTGYAADRWAFDDEVTRVFDDMLNRSIPDYRTMRHLVTGLGSAYVQPGTAIVDLGCSRGEALAPFVERFGGQNTYLGLEISEPMATAARQRFQSSAQVDIRPHDLRLAYPIVRASLTLSVLSLMFVPLEHRQRVLADVFLSTLPGGAVILVEKILGSTNGINARFVERYYEMKSANGYSQEDIDRKRFALEGVLVPVQAAWNEELLRSAGFTQVECFWRWCNFAGWLAVRN